MSPVLVALGVAIPLLVGKLTAGPRPLDIFLSGYPLRIVVTIVYALVLPMAKTVYSGMAGSTAIAQNAQSDEQRADLKQKFYVMLIGAVVLHEIATNFMYVSMPLLVMAGNRSDSNSEPLTDG